MQSLDVFFAVNAARTGKKPASCLVDLLMRSIVKVVREFAVPQTARGIGRSCSAGGLTATGRDRHENPRTISVGEPLMRATRLADALRAAVVVFAVLAVNTSASAQTQDTDGQSIPGRAIPVAGRATQPPGLPIWDTAARQEELDKWIEEFSDWQEWAATWGNRREPGWFRSSRSRRPKPDPPLWLFDACKSVAVEPEATNIPE